MEDIPRICHLYFGGSGPMAKLMVFTILSFHRYNPEWQIKVYKTKQKNNELGKNKYVSVYDGKDYFYMIESLPYVNIKVIDVTDYGIKKDIHSILGSDMFRMKILYDEGGLYSDFDMLWLKPIEELMNVDYFGDIDEFQSTVCFHKWIIGHHTASNILARPRSEFILSIIKEQQKIKAPYGHLDFSTALMNKKYPELKSIPFPVLALRYRTFYPYSIFNLNQLYKADDITPLQDKNVLGIHWFNGHELSQQYIKNRQDCSMTTVLKNEGYDIS